MKLAWQGMGWGSTQIAPLCRARCVWPRYRDHDHSGRHRVRCGRSRKPMCGYTTFWGRSGSARRPSWRVRRALECVYRMYDDCWSTCRAVMLLHRKCVVHRWNPTIQHIIAYSWQAFFGASVWFKDIEIHASEFRFYPGPAVFTGGKPRQRRRFFCTPRRSSTVLNCRRPGPLVLNSCDC